MGTSNFEADSKNAAVEAVERRWRAANAERKRIARNRWLKNVLTLAFLILIAVVGGKFAADYFEIEIPVLAGLDWKGFCSTIINDSISAEEITLRDGYANALDLFRGGDLSMWREAPEKVRPKGAARGTVYLALVVNEKEACSLFRMTANGDGTVAVVRLSPITKEVVVPFAEFKAQRSKGACYIACQGKVYYCEKDGLDAGRLILQKALAKAGLHVTMEN